MTKEEKNAAQGQSLRQEYKPSEWQMPGKRGSNSCPEEQEREFVQFPAFLRLGPTDGTLSVSLPLSLSRPPETANEASSRPPLRHVSCRQRISLVRHCRGGRGLLCCTRIGWRWVGRYARLETQAIKERFSEIMSSQSGIVPSEEVVVKVHEFVSSHKRALLLAIDASSLSVDIGETVSGTSDLDTDLDKIASELLTDVDCRYIILRYDEKKFAFISYVPDNATVRYKMLYASSKNTLLRSLGGELFDPILFVNSADELTADGWRKIVRSMNVEVPLTESELNLKDVKEKELYLNSSKSSNTAKLVSDSSSALLFEIDPELESLLSSDTTARSTLLSLEISQEVLKLINKSEGVAVSSLVELVRPITGPSYHLYTSDTGAQFFILTCPSGSKVRERMLYAANKQGLLNHLKGKGWDFAKVIEAGDADEIELTELQSTTEQAVPETTSAGSGRLRFAKPKGPRRR